MRELLIDVTTATIRVYVLQDGKLIEHYLEKISEKGLVGDIYKGKVENHIKGMNAFFVNIGRDKNAYLSIEDVLSLNPPQKGIRTGDIIMCQVSKDEFENKGARVTMKVTLPGRLLVLTPNSTDINISKKIKDEKQQKKLIDFVEKNKNIKEGFIIRTEAANATEKDILNEIKYLENELRKLKIEFKIAFNSSIIKKECNLIKRVFRDIYSDKIDLVYTNDKQAFSDIKELLKNFSDYDINKLKYVDTTFSLSDHFKFTSQINNLICRRVSLSNGGNIVIDKTEALTVIDVNTSSFVGERDIEKTIFDTNLIAAAEVARQIVLRNISGIIIVDFIDMKSEKDKNKIIEEIKKHLENDRLNSNIIGISELGLLQITRKKVRKSVYSTLLMDCPCCDGSGKTLSPEHLVFLIRQKVNKIFKETNTQCVKVYLNSSIIHKIISQKYLSKHCENEWKEKIIYLIPDLQISQDKYKIVEEYSKVIDLPSDAKLLH